MWKATNRATGQSYTLTDDQKAFYEKAPLTRGKYSFEKIDEPQKRVAEPVGEKAKAEPKKAD